MLLFSSDSHCLSKSLSFIPVMSTWVKTKKAKMYFSWNQTFIILLSLLLGFHFLRIYLSLCLCHVCSDSQSIKEAHSPQSILRALCLKLRVVSSRVLYGELNQRMIRLLFSFLEKSFILRWSSLSWWLTFLIETTRRRTSSHTRPLRICIDRKQLHQSLWQENLLSDSSRLDSWRWWRDSLFEQTQRKRI